MVEISLSGSGEGPGRETSPGYSTAREWRARGRRRAEDARAARGNSPSFPPRSLRSSSPGDRAEMTWAIEIRGEREQQARVGVQDLGGSRARRSSEEV